MKKRCYRIPSFPFQAFIGYAQMSLSGNTIVVYPFNQLFTDITDFIDSCDGLHQSVQIPGLEPAYGGIILPIRFHELVPLLPVYWNKPSITYTPVQRYTILTACLSQPSFYTILITPSKPDNDKEQLQVACGFPLNDSNRKIETFMRVSDFPVDETAKYSSLYIPQNPVRLSWENGTIDRTPFVVKTLKTVYH